MVLVTAGATRNPIDAMRCITAQSSGRTGALLARRLQAAGVPVHLLASPEAALRAPEVPGEIFGSTRDLMARMERRLRDGGSRVVVHAAAVGDYEAAPEPGKVPSGRSRWVLELRPAPKIAPRIRDWAPHVRLVTFKAAPPDTSPDDLVALCARQREATRSDAVFGNVLGALDQGCVLVAEDGAWGPAPREPALDRLVALLLGWCGAGGG